MSTSGNQNSSSSTSSSSASARQARRNALYDYDDAYSPNEENKQGFQGVPVLQSIQEFNPPSAQSSPTSTPRGRQSAVTSPSPHKQKADSPKSVIITSRKPQTRVNGPLPAFITPQAYAAIQARNNTIASSTSIISSTVNSISTTISSTVASSSVLAISRQVSLGPPPAYDASSAQNYPVVVANPDLSDDEDNNYYYHPAMPGIYANMDSQPKEHMRALITQVRPQAIVVAGPPGGGKDTQCAYLEAQGMGLYLHLSTGNMFRKAVEDDTPLGREVAPYIKEGKFVPDELVTKIVLDFIDKANEEKKIPLINGFPRTPEQAHKLCLHSEVSAFILLDVEEKIAQDRVFNRRTDPETGMVYDATPVANAEIEARLARRKADRNPQLVAQRFEAYNHYIGPIVNYFTDVLHVVDGTCSRERVTTVIQQKLDIRKLAQDSFCSCKIRVATRINMPCGHKVWCYSCAQAALNAAQVSAIPCECIFPDCGEEVTRFLTVGRYSAEPEQEEVDEKEEDVNDGISLNASLCRPVKGENALVSIQVRMKDATKRLPVNVVAVIDVSGSMAEEAEFEEDGEMKKAGYTLLEAVKRSLKAVIGCLTPQDSFGLISFSDEAYILHQLQPMTEANVVLAERAIANMQPIKCTNMWAGLNAALTMIKDVTGRTSIMFLTDGEPGDSYGTPVPDMREYVKTHSNIRVDTFGFGSKLEPNLLLKLAELGNGTYTFLPDCMTVPAAFVATMANIGTMCIQNACLEIKTKKGVTFEDNNLRGVTPSTISTKTKTSVKINLGSLHYGQTKNVVVSVYLPATRFPTSSQEVKDKEFKEVYMDVILSSGSDNLAILSCKSNIVTSDAEVAMARAEFTAQVRMAVDDYYKADNAIQTLRTRLNEWKHYHPYIVMLAEEVEQKEMEGKVCMGRVAKACEYNKYYRWGRHYIAAIMLAHERQLRINGMDKSLLMYGGTLADAFEGLGRKIYKDINYQPTAQAAPQATNVTVHVAPAPVTPPPAAVSSDINVPPPAPTRVTSDHTYGRGGGGCFGGNSIIRVLDESKIVCKKVSQVRVGEYVETVLGYVEVTHKACIHQLTSVLPIGGLVITPTHPIRVFAGNWILPQNLGLSSVVVPEVYNFVLKEGASVLIDGVECAVWGHNCQSPSLRHAFYGQREVITTALSKVRIDETGTHHITAFVRDSNDHAIGFV